jgi:hypothetical protein
VQEITPFAITGQLAWDTSHADSLSFRPLVFVG